MDKNDEIVSEQKNSWFYERQVQPNRISKDRKGATKAKDRGGGWRKRSGGGGGGEGGGEVVVMEVVVIEVEEEEEEQSSGGEGGWSRRQNSKRGNESEAWKGTRIKLLLLLKL